MPRWQLPSRSTLLLFSYRETLRSTAQQNYSRYTWSCTIWKPQLWNHYNNSWALTSRSHPDPFAGGTFLQVLHSFATILPLVSRLSYGVRTFLTAQVRRNLPSILKLPCKDTLILRTSRGRVYVIRRGLLLLCNRSVAYICTILL